ncbi:Protein of unknown function [Tessaracoccus bendigoensis DSM 12906]|uniref:Uncharacterized protein n=1 Tax=Tessaracoccus bendigoensis DSM 12906 TaxID=1123357 RepID=A0A1M6N0U1_9ACTN|nr:DUF3618 domain-containing protein [Tessaracoccus bendigoensis]SHJ89236.1 Protein of unknown function [Tessaracoccus bendigoensis DSM 12906]
MASRTVEQLQADLAANRKQMTGSINDLAESLTPQNLARESAEQVKQFAKTEFEAVTLPLREEDGSWKLNKLLLVGGAVLGVIVFAVTLNSVAQRRVITSAQRRAIEK